MSDLSVFFESFTNLTKENLSKEIDFCNEFKGKLKTKSDDSAYMDMVISNAKAITIYETWCQCSIEMIKAGFPKNEVTPHWDEMVEMMNGYRMGVGNEKGR